ncbi:MAG TPA: Hsp20/alpha crystallin family protein [Acidisoma sp.]|uniref:Hsp20/alpha crystallin family protein n=1 Tax=Acidisoma sp. TaxID=1872115 RepID=UPI002C3AA617|nr:Hsp20/alpha crystallin family protein [Acidisoma sp.]HTI03426.1 Hsp20/alpha crystallin family protein [Acidisoma sp.]
MPRSDREGLWSDMLALLARTDQLHRQGLAGVSSAWEPPVDVLETETELLVVIAIPGVPREEVEIVVSHGEVLVRGTRKWLCPQRPARVYRIELPHGRFERRLPLPPGAYQLVSQDHQDGCIVLTMRKL